MHNKIENARSKFLQVIELEGNYKIVSVSYGMFFACAIHNLMQMENKQ